MIPLWISRFNKMLLSFIQLQLVLTLVSLPILIAWGLPFSPLSFVGNFVFAPFLTLFLLVSSLVFFCEVAHIPNGPLIYILEKITSGWLYCIGHGPYSALVGYTSHSPWLLMLLPIIALFFLHQRYVNTPGRRIFACSTVLILFSCYSKFRSSYPLLVKNITCKEDHVILVVHNKTCTLIDTGALGKHPSASSYVEYILVPTITKLTGHVHINNLVLLKPSKRIFDAIAHLCELVAIDTLYLVIWEGTISKPAWHAFWKLKETAQHANISFNRIAKRATAIPLSDALLTLEPTGHTFKKQSFSIPEYQIWAEIDNSFVTIYPSEE